MEKSDVKTKVSSRVDRYTYYLDIASAVCKRSTCLKRRYGCVIVKNDEIIATGYNGSPRGTTNCSDLGICKRMDKPHNSGDYSDCHSVHAEQNAIIQAGQDRCMGASMYIYGHNFICILCKRFIVQSGIVDVYLKKDDNAPIVYVSVDDIRKELEDQQ